MKDILIPVKHDRIVRLVFSGAVHPSLVHQKADHWYFYYDLVHEKKKLSPFVFSHIFFYDIGSGSPALPRPV